MVCDKNIRFASLTVKERWERYEAGLTYFLTPNW